MAFDHHLALGVRQFLPCSGHDLGFNNIYACNELGHRVFNLDAGVHFNEIKLAVFIQKLKGTRTPVAHFFAGRHTTLADAFNEFTGNARRWRFFNDFLMTPLHGAITLTQINGVFVVVGQNLNFNVPWVLQKLFHVYRRVAKGSACFGLGGLHRMDEGSFVVHHTHASPAATTGGFDNDGVANGFGNSADLGWVIGQLAFRTGHTRYTRLDHGLLG